MAEKFRIMMPSGAIQVFSPTSINQDTGSGLGRRGERPREPRMDRYEFDYPELKGLHVMEVIGSATHDYLAVEAL